MSDIALLMQRRMALVERLAALNASQLRNIQMRSGAEVELLACTAAIEANGATPEDRARRAELEARCQAAAAACIACERELDDLAEQLTRLDQAGPGS
jgi:hypothetical protein